MRTFVKTEVGGYIDAATVTDITTTANRGGVVGIKSPTSPDTDHGHIVARLMPDEVYVESNPSAADMKAWANQSAVLAENLLHTICRAEATAKADGNGPSSTTTLKVRSGSSPIWLSVRALNSPETPAAPALARAAPSRLTGLRGLRSPRMQQCSMAFTSLHRALGLEPSALDYSMMQAAIDQQVTEKGDLDWKEKLPDSRNPKGSEEFAKDVAAMVNGGGGMMVYGMAENRESSAAERIVPVEGWSDGIERKLRGWAYSLIQPPVHGLEFTALSQDGDSRVVILEIPASLETPHFAMKDDALRAPRRYGAQTVFMSERDIEQAYRKRFEDRRNNARGLSDLLEQTMTGVDQGGSVWLAAAARPVNPRPAYAGRIGRDDAGEILSSLMTRNPFLKLQSGLENAGLNPRPGYRKWRSTDRYNGRTLGIVDIHDDGSVSLAIEPAPSKDGGFEAGTDVHVMSAQALPAHIVHLARAVAERMDMTGDFEISIVLSPPGNEPVYIRTFEPGINYLRSRDELTPIYKFQPVTGVLAGNGPVNEALETVRDLALDVMNQGGAPALGTMYLKSASDLT